MFTQLVCQASIIKIRNRKRDNEENKARLMGCTLRAILGDGASSCIERNHLKPSHNGNTYPVRLRVFFYDNKQLKLLAMALDQYLTCLIFPLRWACFPIKTSRIAQWVHLFSVDFDDFSTIYLMFSLKPIFHRKLGSRWVPNANEIYTKNMKYTWPTPAFCIGTQRNLYSTDWRRGLALGLTQILGLAS